MVKKYDVRSHFPLLKRGNIYFDSAATSLKPISVLDAEKRYYTHVGLNTGRGVGELNHKTTNIIEKIRSRIAEFIGANSRQIVVTNNATDSINLVAKGYINNIITKHSNIVITQLEHHSNYVPWLELTKKNNIECRIIPLKENALNLEHLDLYIDNNTVLTAITGMSNVTGEIINLKKVIDHSRSVGCKILIDAAQLIVHKKLNVKKLDVDFMVFSGHKLFGTFGIGFLYGKDKLLEDFEPQRYGGNMVTYIKEHNVYYHDVPRKLESGTQNPAALYAFNSALQFLEDYSVYEREEYVQDLGEYLFKKLTNLGGIFIYSKPNPIISFNIQGVHPHDAPEFFDKEGIIIRTGNLCASPFFLNRDFNGVIRVSLSIFNTRDEIDKLCKVVNQIKEFFL